MAGCGSASAGCGGRGGRSFTVAPTDLVTATTTTYAEEATGITLAAQASGLPVVISFTVEIDGRVQTSQPLGDAFQTVDAATGRCPAYYMLDCPTRRISHVFGDAPGWTERVGGLRAMASTLSHTELYEAETLDGGDSNLGGLVRGQIVRS